MKILKTVIKIIGSFFNQNPHNKVGHSDTPCYECIKRGGVCQPECEKRIRSER